MGEFPILVRRALDAIEAGTARHYDALVLRCRLRVMRGAMDSLTAERDQLRIRITELEHQIDAKQLDDLGCQQEEQVDIAQAVEDGATTLIVTAGW